MYLAAVAATVLAGVIGGLFDHNDLYPILVKISYNSIYLSFSGKFIPFIQDSVVNKKLKGGN